MRKYLKAILFLVAAVALMSVTALAADAGGIYNVTVAEDYKTTVTVTPQTDKGVPVTATTENINGTNYDYYAGAVKVEVQYTGANSSSYYLILAQNAVGTPNDTNIVYIDQGELGKATFKVYPSSLTTDTTYYIYLSSTGSAKTLIASFQYYVPYTPGDVNNDGTINVNDAMAVIYHIVGKNILTGNNLLAAEVTNDNPPNINVNDAMEIIYYLVGRPQYLK